MGFPIRQRFWAMSVKMVPFTKSLDRRNSGFGEPSSNNCCLRSGELHSLFESLSSSDEEFVAEESDVVVDDFCCGFFSWLKTRFRLRICCWLFSQTAAIRLRISNFWKTIFFYIIQNDKQNIFVWRHFFRYHFHVYNDFIQFF